jgi:alpha-1,2-mannosyltransferase
VSIRSFSDAWEFLGRLPEKPALRFAALIWAVIAVVVFTIVAIQPDKRTATLEYQKASTRWWDSDNLYKGKNNYLYLPQAAMLYTPFNVLPKRVGEPLWRMVCLGSLAFGLWAAARHLAPGRAGALFLMATLLVLPCSLSSARNGQVNMPLAAIYLLTALTLARQRWHVAALLLALSLALKPISVVPILLCGVLFPRTILPLILWLGLMLAAAYLHPDPKYVTWQYGVFWEKLTGSSAKPTGQTWSDFAGMLDQFHLSISQSAQTLIRAGAAVLTFGASLVAVWKIQDVLRRALTVMFFAVIYLMLFNPRTETNSYIILGIFIALLGAHAVVAGQIPMPSLAWTLVAVVSLAVVQLAVFSLQTESPPFAALGILVLLLGACVALALRAPWPAVSWTLIALMLGAENYGNWIFRPTNLWLKPLVALGLGFWLTARVLRMPKGEKAVF